MSEYQAGDIIVFKRVPQGVREKEFLITGLVIEDGTSKHGNVKVEYANPLKWMSGLVNEPEEPIRFGDTESYVEPFKIVSHHRPE